MSAPDTSAYILATQDTADLPNSRIIEGGTGIAIEDTGPGGAITVSVSQTVAALENLSDGATGYLVKTGANTISTASITSSSNTITVTNGNGVAGNTNIDVIADTTVQQTIVSLNGVEQATRPQLNFIPGTGAGITIVDNPGDNAVDITVTSTGSDAANWSEYPATQNVSFGGFNITGVSKASIGYAGLTNSGNFGLNLAQTVEQENACIWMQNADLPSIEASADGVTLSANNNGLVLTNSSANHYVPVTDDNSISNGDLLVGTSAGIFATVPVGTAGQVLTSNGTTVEWTTSGSGGAPSDATYIVQTPNSGLSNEQALSLLSTGLVKVTTETGVLSTAVAGTDYVAPSTAITALNNLSAPAVGDLVLGVADGLFSNLAIGASGQVLASNGTTAQWTTAPAQAFEVSYDSIEGATLSVLPLKQYIITASPGSSQPVLQLDIPAQPDGSWLYVQLTAASTSTLEVYAGATLVTTISDADNIPHYFIRSNGEWFKAY